MRDTEDKPSTDLEVRQCPTHRGDARPLIAHHVGVNLCLSRQRDFYHKCHRCVYRGKSATYVLPEADASADTA